MKMRAFRWWALALALALALGAACGADQSPAAPPTPAGPAAAPGPGAAGAPAPASRAGVGQDVGGLGVPALGSSQQTGIWVSGTGRVVAQPDRAVLSLGVEARGATVAQARADAARAMNAVVAALKARRVQDRDIQTQSFHITPQYVWKERVDPTGARYGEQVLTGYLVTNQASVVVRDLGQVGELVDATAQAGGNFTRIQGISFTIEDPTRLHQQAREAAVRDAQAKAQQFATLTNVALGRLVYISESAATPAVRAEVARAGIAAVSAEQPTPIGGGELTVEVTVQTVFAIQ